VHELRGRFKLPPSLSTLGVPRFPSGGALRFEVAKDGLGRSERLSALGRQPCTQRAVLRPWLGWA
jgi:hypothetical protein